MNNFSWPVVGHAKIQQFLQKSLANDKLAHAYLFSGNSHLGKSLVAQKFIESILCRDYHQQNKKNAAILPCGQCVFCRQIAKKIHPDIYFLRKEDGKKNISVEQVREMQKFLSLTSFLNSYKIAVIENAQELSESAQNALLKALEEPAPKTILILLALDSNLLLPTIVSRCQLIKFRPIASDQIFHHLISLGAGREQSRILSSLACGQIGQAINYFQSPELFNDYLEKTEEIIGLFGQDLIARFKSIEQTFRNAKDSADTADAWKNELDSWQLILRDILAARCNLDHLIVNLRYQPQIKKLAGTYDANKLVALLNRAKEVKNYLNYNINPRLAVENLIISL